MSIGFSNLSTLLSQYGVGNSGNIQTDLAALKKAMLAKGQSTSAVDSFASFVAQIEKTKKNDKTNSASSTDGTQQTDQTQKGQGPQGGPPWASLMQQLGLELQGSPEADFAAMSQKLSEMSASATTPEQKANITSLQSQFEQYQSMAPQGAGGQGMSIPNFGNSMLQNLANNQQTQNGEQNSNGRPSFQLPWNSLLDSVGIDPQGSPQADFAAIAQKLTEMTASDTTGSQASTIAALQAKLAQYKNQASTMVVRS